MLIVALWAILILIVFVVIPYGAALINNRQLEQCKPFTHRWDVTHISGGTGRELRRCKNCSKITTRGE